jgi:hypothetical protein
MKLQYGLVTICLVFFWGSGGLAVAVVSSPDVNSVFVWDIENLRIVKQKIQNQDPFYLTAFEQLKQQGQEALKAGPFSVVNKKEIPPSGDKHDYISLAPYWWPNPDTKDGLPYIRKDGIRNPQSSAPGTDAKSLDEMSDAVESLGLCYFLTNDPNYARHAAVLLRTWFLDPKTRMNPNLNHGQFIPGQNTGRGTGIIDTVPFTRVVDTAGLLQGNSYWTEKDKKELQQWFREYLQWLIQSPHGKEESRALNNHSTWYDVQVVSFALFVGDQSLAKNILEHSADKHIAKKIEPDGSQPQELVRTRAFSYSLMNLRGTFILARLGEHVGVDLWNYETKDGRSLRKALEFLIPYIDPQTKWPWQQISDPVRAAGLYSLIKQAQIKIKGFNAEPALKKFSQENILHQHEIPDRSGTADPRDFLLYP